MRCAERIKSQVGLQSSVAAGSITSLWTNKRALVDGGRLCV